MPSNTLVRHLKVEAMVHESDITPGLNGPKLTMPEALATGGGFVVAKFRVAAGGTLSLSFHAVSSKLTKAGSITSLPEEAGGIVFSKMCGYDVVVKRTAPGSAVAGTITVDPNPYFAAPTPAALGENDHTGHFVNLGLTLVTATALAIDASGATNLEAHVLVYGIAA